MSGIAVLSIALVLLAATPGRAGDKAGPFVAPDEGRKAAAAQSVPLVLVCGAAADAFAAKVAALAMGKRFANADIAWVLLEPDGKEAAEAKLARGDLAVAGFEGEALGRFCQKEELHKLEVLLDKAIRHCKTKKAEIDRVTKALDAAEKALKTPPYARAWNALAPVAALGDKPGALGKLGAKAKKDLEAIRAEVARRCKETKGVIGEGKAAAAQVLIRGLVSDCQGVLDLEKDVLDVRRTYNNAFDG